MFVFSFVFSVYNLTAFSANRGIEPIIKIESVENETSLHLYFANLLEQTTYIELIDNKGQIVYNETISDQKAYAKKLDLSQINDGKYTVFVENRRIEVTQPILIEDDMVMVLAEKRAEKVAPSIEFVDNAVFFQLAPGLRAKRVTINILKGEEIIYESKEVLMSKMKKKYALDNLYRGAYTFRAVVDGKAYYQQIEIR